MTTWQDQQPMSRRALRESERAHAQAVLSDTGEMAPQETSSDQQIWPSAPNAEPLDYATQARQQSPAADQPMRRPRPSGSAYGTSDAAGYRVRDFSPEGRGTSFSATQPTTSAPWTPPAAGSEDLSYHTSVEFERAAPTAFSGPVSVPPVVVTPEEVSPESSTPAAQPGPPEEHTLTRRELREMRNVARATVEEQPEVATVAGEPTIMIPRSEQSAELAAAMAEFDAIFLAKASAPSGPPLVEPIPLVEPLRQAPSAPEQQAPASVSPAAMPPAPEASAPQAATTQASAPTTPAAEAPVASAPFVAPPATPEPAPVTSAPVDREPVIPAEPLREIITAPEVYAAPVGHWSNQTGIDDEFAGNIGTHSRNIAASDAITTSALVLPAFPQTGPLTGPVNSTGEILLTGSIDLPRSLGMNGLNPARYDRADIDAVIDAGDREDSAPDSAPVRAIRAVSTHTSSQGIINVKRPKGSNLPMILSITAGVMAVGVIVLFVAGMIFKIF